MSCRRSSTSRGSAPSSTLTDDEWRLVRDLLEPQPGRRGRPPAISRRAIADAILYLARTGSPWRYLPSEYPPWGTVWQQFRGWRDSGVWGKLLTRLRQIARLMKGRALDPSMLMVDAQVARGGVVGNVGSGRSGMVRCQNRPTCRYFLAMQFESKIGNNRALLH